MSNVTAVLIEVVSIQQYVYSSNRLKENIGSSNVINNIYKNSLKKSLQKVLKHNLDLATWEDKPENIFINESNTDFEVGYIGGGNAFLLFKDKLKANDFIKEWTRSLLIEAPSLSTAFALSNFNLDDFSMEFKKLHRKLQKNKNKYFPQTFLPKHAITADCPYSGLSADISEDAEGKGSYISSSSYAKYQHLNEDEAKRDAEKISIGRFTITTNIDNLGQTKGENHIAIVHIDGNSMAEQFKSCQGLLEIRKLSKCVKDIMLNVYKEFLDFVINQMDFFKKEENGFEIKQQENKDILPFRPILIAGDDITFITDGRLGLPFAEKYLELISKKSILNGKKKISACAGVAITKTKYPFFRGYTLAEELCQNAKIEARENKDTSWLDFHVAYGGFSGSLSEIRRKKYFTKDGQLHFGPYLVASKDLNKEKNIIHLKNGIKDFIDRKKWPRSIVKEFGESLTMGRKVSEKFRDQAKLKGRPLYDLKETGKGYSTNVWENESTPYFDMIELLEFYPEYFLPKEGGGL